MEDSGDAAKVSAEQYDLRACRQMDPDIFFPVESSNVELRAAVDAARAICDNCVIRDPCYENAVARGEKFGIWGGRLLEVKNQRRRKAS